MNENEKLGEGSPIDIHNEKSWNFRPLTSGLGLHRRKKESPFLAPSSLKDSKREEVYEQEEVDLGSSQLLQGFQTQNSSPSILENSISLEKKTHEGIAGLWSPFWGALCGLFSGAFLLALMLYATGHLLVPEESFHLLLKNFFSHKLHLFLLLSFCIISGFMTYKIFSKNQTHSSS